jgi:DNA-3-methyladenine glycosylase
VLVRAIQPDFGVEAMAKRRGTDNLYNLASGPGKLTQALDIGYELNNKRLDETYIYVEEGKKTSRDKSCSGRIGISRAKDLEYRFFIKGNRFVSRRSEKT